jgi:hypothetical protein
VKPPLAPVKRIPESGFSSLLDLCPHASQGKSESAQRSLTVGRPPSKGSAAWCGTAAGALLDSLLLQYNGISVKRVSLNKASNDDYA